MDQMTVSSRSIIKRMMLGVLGLAVLVVVAAAVFALVSVATGGTLVVVTAIVLGFMLLATCVVCAHVGGHAWFIPLPAAAAAAAWVLAAATSTSAAAWWLVAACALGCGAGLMVVSTALRQGPPAAKEPVLAPGDSGLAVTALSPTGVVRINGETWTASSLSGSLPAGAPVHVVRRDGLHVEVWSESGEVLDADHLAAGTTFSPGQQGAGPRQLPEENSP